MKQTSRYKLLASVGVAFIATMAITSVAYADTLSDIVEKGKMSVGIKTDYAPWGMRDKDGNIVGMEIDMVRDFARRLGEAAGKEITVELIPVVASNRMEFLQQGKIDVMIATMNDTQERRKIVGTIQPNYYASGTTILARKDSGIDGWESISGKKICGIQGTWYNKEYGLKYGAEMVTFAGVPETEAAVLDRRCEGWLYDDSAFVPRMTADPAKWADFKIATPVVAVVPWTAAVRLEDRDAPLGKALSAAIIDWHKSGFLIDLEAKWSIPATKWLADMHDKCVANDPICNDTVDRGE